MSNMSALGFPVADEREFIALALQAAEQGDPQGSYVRWAVGEGIELWAQVMDGEVCGMNPHFAGPARMRVRLDRRIEPPGGPPMDGALLGWADPTGEGDGAYPLCLDCPDARRLDDVDLPRVAEVQVAAFAHEFEAWPTVAAYEESQGAGGGLACRSFIPAGLFDPASGPVDPPRPFGLITGVALASRRLRNPVTGREFHHFHLESYGGEFDALAAPDQVPEPPPAGGVVQGMFWLSGRVVAWYPQGAP